MAFKRLMNELGASERFEVLAELAGTFSKMPSSGWGYPEGEIEAARLAMPALTGGRAGARLPATLVRWWRDVGRVRELTAAQNQLLAPHRLKLHGDIVVIYTEAQHCALWGIRVEDLAHDDPPVVYLAGESQDQETEALSRFALMVGLFELCLSGSGVPCSGHVNERAMEVLRRELHVLPVPTFRWPLAGRISHFLADDDILVLMETYCVFAISTRPDIAEYLMNLAAPGIFQSDGLWEPS